MNIRNLVFGGDGVDGTAYVGALQQFEQQLGTLRQIKRVAGTSSGSIVSALVALNYTAAEVTAAYNTLDFTKIISHNIVTELYNIATTHSINSNTELRTAIEDLLETATGNAFITFGDLAAQGFKDLHVITTRMVMNNGYETLQEHVFSAEKTPLTKIAVALLASASIPFIFPMLYLKETQPGKWEESSDADSFIHLDGGAVRDFAIRAFDKYKYLDVSDDKKDGEEQIYNTQTVGFITYPLSPVQIGTSYNQTIPHNETSIIKAIYNGVVGNKNVSQVDLKRTVLINDHGILATNFAITSAQKKSLIQAGVDAVTTYFRKFVNLASSNYSSSVDTLFPPPPTAGRNDTPPSPTLFPQTPFHSPTNPSPLIPHKP